MSQKLMTVEESYRYCKMLVKKDKDKWPIEIIPLSAAEKRSLYVLWAFLRALDDFTDEGNYVPKERSQWLTNERRFRWLDTYSQQVAACYRKEATLPIFIALQDVINKYAIPEYLFQKLIDGFKQDLIITRYPTFEALFDYIDKVSNPLGRIFLIIQSYYDEKLYLFSDYFITAMQLTDFWLDVFVDAKIDRIYIPLEDLAKFNCNEDDILAERISPNFKALLAYEIKRTQEIFSQAEPLFKQLSYKHAIFFKTIYNSGLGRLKLIIKNDYDLIDAKYKITLIQKLSWITKALF